MRISLVCVLAIFPFAGLAQGVKLDFGTASPRDVWISESYPTTAPKDSTRASEATHVLDASKASKKAIAFVWDQSSGMVAVKPVSEIAEGWKIAPADYKFIGFLSLKVESKGTPVSAAAIKLTDGKRTIDQLLDPSMKGETRFFVIQPGNVTVQVQYNTNGKPAAPVTQQFEVALTSESPEAHIAISLPEATETTGDKATKPAAKEESGNPIGRIIFFLIVLAGASGLGYYLLQLAKKNEGPLKAKLKDLGVQIPDPQDDDAPNAPIPTIPEPMKPIILGDAPPEPMTSTPTGQPRLVGDNTTHNLNEGEAIVSRDAGSGLSLAGETTVSRQHAKIVRTGPTVLVEDLGSTNGTFVNSVRIQSAVELKQGDTVQFGAVRFRYEG